MAQISIEGCSPEEILNLPDEDLESIVFVGKPIVFRVGSAEILGEFKVKDETLIVELAQIDGGGEGVLPILASLAQRYAEKRKLRRIEWVVHALNCAKPNPKLRRVMERRGFIVQNVAGIGTAFYLLHEVEPSHSPNSMKR
jgi:hypothetical protein